MPDRTGSLPLPRLSSATGRLLVGVPAALAVSIGLFATMETMIRPGEVTLDEDRSITLRNFIADKSDLEIRTRQSRVRKIDDAEKPPPPPKLTARRQKLDLPTPQLEGAAPERIDVDRMGGIDVSSVVIDDRNAQPIRPPLCRFPRRAASRGIEGNCEVHLNVNPRGQPYGVRAECDHALFVREAERCVGKTEFAPKISRGRAVERRGVIYPLEFSLVENDR